MALNDKFLEYPLLKVLNAYSDHKSVWDTEKQETREKITLTTAVSQMEDDHFNAEFCLEAFLNACN
jgi:hypothetical protein